MTVTVMFRNTPQETESGDKFLATYDHASGDLWIAVGGERYFRSFAKAYNPNMSAHRLRCGNTRAACRVFLDVSRFAHAFGMSLKWF
jgi:hypothetical protein